MDPSERREDLGGIPRDPVTDKSKLRCWRYHYRDRLYMKGLVYGGLNFARGGVIEEVMIIKVTPLS